MTPTPSIMMLVSPPPPMRVGSPVGVTPGASEASAVKLRLAIGRFSTALVGMVKERSPLARLHQRRLGLDDHGIGDAADFDSKSADRLAVAGLTLTPVCLAGLNPLIETWTVYLSAGTLTTVKSPLSLVTTSGSFVPRVSLVRVTDAPGMTPPWGSLTVPVTVPVTCADALPVNAHSARPAAASILSRAANILLLPEVCARTPRGCRNQPGRYVFRVSVAGG